VRIEEHAGYTTIPYRLIFMVLDRLELGPQDVFVDLGCGRGRVLCCAARYRVREIIGVEDMTELAKAAEANLHGMKGAGTTRRQVVCGKAQDFDYAGVTAIFMFNPFGPRTLDQVLAKLRSSLAHGPETQKFRLAYVHPLHESVIARVGWLERYDYWPPERLPDRKLSVSFWGNASIRNGTSGVACCER
jgi:cyclopropane fatty-acyl-phospholipid synthase-like methyltransferase